MKPVAEMTDAEVRLAHNWGATVRLETMRDQLAWEQACKKRGTFAPWPGAEWDGYTWKGGDPRKKWED
jgi:hypothetical protein